MELFILGIGLYFVRFTNKDTPRVILMTRLSINEIRFTGYAGIAAALLVGIGEFLLHFDSLARFEGYQFMVDISESRMNWGHFIAVVGMPFYFIGCWHIYLQLREAGPRLAFTAFVVGSVGFLFGAIWMGSRAMIGSLVHHEELVAATNLVSLYEMRYESLLQVTRVTMLVLSAIYVYLVLKGGSSYPRWMACLNPFLLIVASFILYTVAPSIGKYPMPIALNVAFFIFFTTSLIFSGNKSKGESI